MSNFKVSSGPVSADEAVKYADDLETVIGEICNRQREPQNIPMEPMVSLIQFARDSSAERDRLQALSVEHILLRVVPGDGDGHEVYAKSVGDVEQLLGEAFERLDTMELQRDQLLEATEAAYELLKVIHDETGKVGLQLRAAIAAVRGE